MKDETKRALKIADSIDGEGLDEDARRKLAVLVERGIAVVRMDDERKTLNFGYAGEELYTVCDWGVDNSHCRTAFAAAIEIMAAHYTDYPEWEEEWRKMTDTKIYSIDSYDLTAFVKDGGNRFGWHFGPMEEEDGDGCFSPDTTDSYSLDFKKYLEGASLKCGLVEGTLDGGKPDDVAWFLVCIPVRNGEETDPWSVFFVDPEKGEIFPKVSHEYAEAIRNGTGDAGFVKHFKMEA